MDCCYTFFLCGIFVADGSAGIGGTIVHQDDLDVLAHHGPPEDHEAAADAVRALAVVTAVALDGAGGLAVEALGVPVDIALIDGNTARGFDCKTRTVVKGDSISPSIAAASVLAKVSRDRYICALADKYPQYGFEKHKGYCTKAHTEALRRYGPCEIHRMSFLKKIL